MSRMLTFSYASSAVLAARTRAAGGRTADAIAALEAALATGSLTPDAAADARHVAARLLCEIERYGKARRHLKAALQLRPTDAALYHELGLAYQDDPYGCDRRAAAQFRLAVKSAPDAATYRAALGLALVRLNKVRAGLRELQRAVEFAPTNADVFAVVLDALREAGRPRLGLKWLAKARFLAPNDAALSQLWDRARFDVAQCGQERGRRVGRGPTVRPVAVPFVRLATESAPRAVAGGIVRADAGSRAVPHVGRLRAHRS